QACEDLKWRNQNVDRVLHLMKKKAKWFKRHDFSANFVREVADDICEGNCLTPRQVIVARKLRFKPGQDFTPCENPPIPTPTPTGTPTPSPTGTPRPTPTPTATPTPSPTPTPTPRP